MKYDDIKYGWKPKNPLSSTYTNVLLVISYYLLELYTNTTIYTVYSIILIKKYGVTLGCVGNLTELWLHFGWVPKESLEVEVQPDLTDCWNNNLNSFQTIQDLLKTV